MNTTQVRVQRVGAIGVAVLIGVAATGMRPSTAQEPPASNSTQSGRTGLRAYIDPHTGALGVPPPGAEAPPAAGRRLADVGEVPSAGSAGGVMVNTKGRFNADVTATTDASGTTVQCAPHGSAHSSAPADRQQ